MGSENTSQTLMFEGHPVCNLTLTYSLQTPLTKFPAPPNTELKLY